MKILLNDLKLAEAQKELADLLADPDYASLVVDELTIKKLQVKLAELELNLTLARLH